MSTACGLHHSVFVTANGEVYSCGFNDNGQLGHNDTRSRNSPFLVESLKNKFIVQAACGYYHTMVMRDSGEIYAFGRNDKGQLGIETNLQALIAPKQITEFLTVTLVYNSGNQNQFHSS
jgi:RCC1 and BTB domain-containing protein